MKNSAMGNKTSSNNKETLPIKIIFKLPTNIPVWPQGGEFASGVIDLGGLKVSQISTFNNVWTTLEGGPGNAGATFFEPTGIPEGFFTLGFYSQPNNTPLFGWVLVAKDEASSDNIGALKKPVDYTLIWSSNSQKIKQDKDGYVWLPTAPDGYKALGHVVTTTPEKPSLDKIRCVRSDLTDQCETNSWIWGPGKSNDDKGFNVHEVRPSNRGIEAPGVLVGTFLAHVGGTTTSPLPISCLKNTNMNFSSMPNVPQVQALVQAYSPFMYLHPDEKFHPASVKWYFTNGALLFKKGEESNPVPIDPKGSNLPQGGNNDGNFWLDLPADKANKERVKKGDFKSSQAYVHAKPIFGGTFTDLAMWVFYPFNGPGTAKVGPIDHVPLGKIGEHVGDWEHVTLRVSNFNGELRKVYFSQHSKGQWVEAPQLEFQSGNKAVAYSSLNGHAIYPKEGVVMQGLKDIGIRNDSAKSDMVVDLGLNFQLVSGEYLGSAVIEPPWLNYFREWGPKITYDIKEELDKIPALKALGVKLPNELLGEEGPTGPKLKRNWSGDEVV